jgi:hypothetical protein
MHESLTAFLCQEAGCVVPLTDAVHDLAALLIPAAAP